MFENIGGKIKNLAKIVCWIGVVGYVIAGMIMIGIGVEEYENGLTSFGFILLIVGPLMSWISSFFMYGFGELVEKTTEILDILFSTTKHDIKQNKNDELKEMLASGLITEAEYAEKISGVVK